MEIRISLEVQNFIIKNLLRDPESAMHMGFEIVRQDKDSPRILKSIDGYPVLIIDPELSEVK